jgi:ComF family protein
MYIFLLTMFHFVAILSTMPNIMLQSISARADLLFLAILDTLAPRHCLLCEQILTSNIGSRFACQGCMDALPPSPPNDVLIASMAQHFPSDNLALHGITARFHLNDSLQRGNPTTPLQALIYALKYGNKPSIGQELGYELGAFLAWQNMTYFDALVPVPLHHARVRERGYNQAEVLAKGIGEVVHIPVQSAWLRRSRYTRSQTLLTAGERRSNLQNVIVGGTQREHISGKCILLVDDILTTGATLNSCALALLECGARSVDAVVLAKA